MRSVLRQTEDQLRTRHNFLAVVAFQVLIQVVLHHREAVTIMLIIPVCHSRLLVPCDVLMKGSIALLLGFGAHIMHLFDRNVVETLAFAIPRRDENLCGIRCWGNIRVTVNFGTNGNYQQIPMDSTP